MEGNYPAPSSNPRFNERTEIRGVSQSQRGTISCFVERRGRGDKTPVNTDDEESLSRRSSSACLNGLVTSGLAADVPMNIKGLGKRCALRVTEKPLWGVPERPPQPPFCFSNSTGEMTRMKGRTGRRGSPPSSLLLSICCLSRSAILLTSLTPPLLSQV